MGNQTQSSTHQKVVQVLIIKSTCENKHVQIIKTVVD
jgi:hypothetical protein